MLVFGIDISKDNFHVCAKEKGSDGNVKIKGSRNFSNDFKGFTELTQWVSKRQKPGSRVRYIMEATGSYYEELAYYLYESGSQVSVVLANGRTGLPATDAFYFGNLLWNAIKYSPGGGRVTVSVEAGLGFDSAVARVARNTKGPLSQEFARLLQRMERLLGIVFIQIGIAELVERNRFTLAIAKLTRQFKGLRIGFHRRIRFALVGCGRIAKNHVDAIAKHAERATLAGYDWGGRASCCASALRRMDLYVETFGLTRLRLLSALREAHEEIGLPPDAVVRAASQRLRPILMTTGAMVLGAVPLALSAGAGAESRIQIGWVIVGGMSLGTVLTVFVVPTMYLLFARKEVPGANKAEAKEEPLAGHHGDLVAK